MHSRFRSIGYAFAALAIGMTLLASPGTAVAATEAPLPAAAKAVLDNLAAGQQLTDADRAVLVSYPEIASQVLDPGRTTVTATTPKADTSVTAADGVSANGCWVHNVDVYGYTALGFVAYVFHHEVHWCEDGSRVLGMHYRNAWATQLEGTMYWRGLQGNSATPTPDYQAQSFMQGAIENCVLKYGCIRTNYPWSRHYLSGNGNWSYSWGH